MLNKEEIEKAKEVLAVMDIEESGNATCGKCVFDDDKKCYDENGDCQMRAIETLLQYINQLEQENNKLNKMINEIAKEINSGMLDKIDWCKLYNKGTCGCDDTCLKCLKQYFEKKAEGK